MWQKAIHKTATLLQLLLVHLWQDVADVIPRVPVQPLLEPLLIEEVADEPDATSEHKHSIQRAGLDVRLCLILGEEPTLSQQINKANSNAAVHVEDEIWLLLSGDLFHLLGIVKQRGAGEVLLGKLCHQGHSLVRVVQALDAMPNAHYKTALLLSVVDKVHGNGAGVKSVSEHPSGFI